MASDSFGFPDDYLAGQPAKPDQPGGHLVYSIRTCGHLLIYRELPNGEFELVECPDPEAYSERADRFKKFMAGKKCPGCGKIIAECMRHGQPVLDTEFSRNDLNFAEEVDIGRENMEFLHNYLDRVRAPKDAPKPNE